MIHLTESFKREDFPNRDPDTGSLTMTGYIPRVNNLTKYGWVFVAVFHGIQSALRMTFNHSMIFTTWYPFDASISPVYEIVNMSQVQCKILSTSYMIINLSQAQCMSVNSQPITRAMYEAVSASNVQCIRLSPS